MIGACYNVIVMTVNSV